MAVGKYIPTLLTIVLIVIGDDAEGVAIDAITDFTCNPLGHMNMKVPSWVHGVTVICTTQSQGSTPASQQLTPTSTTGAATLKNRNVTITNCIKGEDATLIMYAQTVSTTSPQVQSTKQLSAQVTLRCTAKTDKVKWTDTVQFSIQGLRPTLPGVSATETIDKLSMKLLESTTNFPSATEVSLGEEYILIISGEEPYFKKVKSCNASKTNGNFQSGVEVFNNTVNALNDDTIKANLTSLHIVKPNAHDALLSMTGFRLVGSTTVYLQCTLDICKSECSTKRKRKKSSTPSKLRYATMKFEVQDKMFTPSSSGIKGIHSMTGSFVLLFTVTVLGFQTI